MIVYKHTIRLSRPIFSLVFAECIVCAIFANSQWIPTLRATHYQAPNMSCTNLLPWQLQTLLIVLLNMETQTRKWMWKESLAKMFAFSFSSTQEYCYFWQTLYLAMISWCVSRHTSLSFSFPKTTQTVSTPPPPPHTHTHTHTRPSPQKYHKFVSDPLLSLKGLSFETNVMFLYRQYQTCAPLLLPLASFLFHRWWEHAEAEFTTLPLPLYYSQTQTKDEKHRRPGNEANIFQYSIVL